MLLIMWLIMDHEPCCIVLLVWLLWQCLEICVVEMSMKALSGKQSGWRLSRRCKGFHCDSAEQLHQQPTVQKRAARLHRRCPIRRVAASQFNLQGSLVPAPLAPSPCPLP